MTDHACSQAKYNKKNRILKEQLHSQTMSECLRFPLRQEYWILMAKLGRVIWSLLHWIPGLLHRVARIPGLLLHCVAGMYNRDTYTTNGENENNEYSTMFFLYSSRCFTRETHRSIFKKFFTRLKPKAIQCVIVYLF